jgi:hypothetical protein
MPRALETDNVPQNRRAPVVASDVAGSSHPSVHKASKKRLGEYRVKNNENMAAAA